MTEKLRKDEAAALARVSRRTISAWVARGWVKATRPTRRVTLIDRASLMAFLETNNAPAGVK